MDTLTATKTSDPVLVAGARVAAEAETRPPGAGNGTGAGAPQPTEAGGPLLVSTRNMAARLNEAELLLGYAAGIGIKVDDGVRDSVLDARIACDSGRITKEVASNLLRSLSTLALSVRPVTVDSLRASDDPRDARNTVRFFGTMAVVVGGIIMLVSMVTFFCNSVSEKIKGDIVVANALAAKLRSELGPSPVAQPAPPGASLGVPQDVVWFGAGGIPAGLSDKDVISDLQEFAATMREIDGFARQLRFYVFDFSAHNYPDGKQAVAHRPALELTPGLPGLLSVELTDRISDYQWVRSFGNNIQERVTLYYGTIATCILPVLYALLGAGAYLLRMFEDQIKNRTLVAGDRHVARFLIAGIGGLVVGLFNNVTQGITYSPFAMAFLVGYAADVFFTFLEGLLQIFRRGSGSAAAGPAPGGVS